MTEKQNVLMVHNYYQIGGGEHTVFENEVNMLRNNGHKVICYTRSNDELKSSKLKLLMLPLTTIWSFKTYFEVKKIIKRENIDVVHCHNTFPLISPSVYYAARSLKKPVVQTIHNFRLLCPNGIFYRDGHICEECRECNSFKSALKHKCYRNSFVQTSVVVAMLKVHRWLGTYSRISYIFLTDFNRRKFDKLIDIEGNNVFIKPNFVKQPDIEKTDKTIDKNIFVFAGRLEENKGVDFLLKAWEEMPEDYELHIYGDGSLKEVVEKADKEKSNVKHYGFAPQKVIFEDLIKAKAMVFPSKLYEGYPMTIAESMALGVPVIVTDIGNHGDIVKSSQGGISFEKDNIKSFKNAIREMIDYDSYSIKAKNYYVSTLNETVNYQQICDIYSSINNR